MLAAMSFGNCGYAFPVVMRRQGGGARTGPAIAYVGDGAWGMSFNELLTCVREKIGVTVVVFNNEQWGAEKKNHVDFYSQRFQGVNSRTRAGPACAKAFGCEGIWSTSSAMSARRCEKAVAHQKKARPRCSRLMVTKELGDPFRRDALSVPVRHLEKYKGYV